MNQERTRELLERVLPREAVGTFAPLPDVPCASPATEAEAAEVVRLATSERWCLLPAGSGTKLGWARAPERVDVVLSSARLAGIVAHEPADGTITARAGTTWAELERATRGAHHVSPELPLAGRATLGGAIGAGASGLDRLRYGPVRHQILGLQAIHPDGSRVKSGGRVVKNVTGYDLHRLWCGSRGTLCFLTEATLRLHPAPAREAVVTARRATRAEALASAHALLRGGVRSGVQPLALLLHDDERGWQLDLVLAGREEVVRAELETARALLGAAEVVEGEAARAARAGLREREHADGRWSPLWFSCRPSRLAAALERLETASRELGLATRILCHPLLACAAVWPGTAPGLEELRGLQRALGAAELDLAWRDVPPGLARESRLDGPALALMQRLKQAIDPQGVFARGALP